MKIVKISKEQFSSITNDTSLMQVIVEEDIKLFGGLDYYTKYPKQIKVYDRGCNGKANDIILRIK